MAAGRASTLLIWQRSCRRSGSRIYQQHPRPRKEPQRLRILTRGTGLSSSLSLKRLGRARQGADREPLDLSRSPLPWLSPCADLEQPTQMYRAALARVDAPHPNLFTLLEPP
eukprot:363803-Chlamydomonas_euryale.AAC.5